MHKINIGWIKDLSVRASLVVQWLKMAGLPASAGDMDSIPGLGRFPDALHILGQDSTYLGTTKPVGHND